MGDSKGRKLLGLAGLAGGLGSEDRSDEKGDGDGDTGRDHEDEGSAGKEAAMEEFHAAHKAGDFKAMSDALDDHRAIGKKANT